MIGFIKKLYSFQIWNFNGPPKYDATISEADLVSGLLPVFPNVNLFYNLIIL